MKFYFLQVLKSFNISLSLYTRASIHISDYSSVLSPPSFGANVNLYFVGNGTTINISPSFFNCSLSLAKLQRTSEEMEC